MADGSNLPAAAPDQAQAFVPSDIHGLRGVDPQVIMQRVAEGELLRDIAKDYGVSRSAVSVHIARHANPDGWKAAREQSIAARLEQSLDEMSSADDVVALARARDKAKLWMWRAERELPHIYGQRTQVTHEVGPDLGNLLREAKNRVSSSQQHIESDSVIDVTPDKTA